MKEIEKNIKKDCHHSIQFQRLGDLAIIASGKTITRNEIKNNIGKYPVINSGRSPLGYYNKWNTENDPIGITSRGSGVGTITWTDGKYFRGNLNYSVTIKNKNLLNVRFLYYVLIFKQKEILNVCTLTTIPALNISDLKEIQIPVPPIAIQEKIVENIDNLRDKKDRLIKLLIRKKELYVQQYNYYQDKLLNCKNYDKVELLELCDVFNISAGGDKPKKIVYTGKTEECGIPVISNGVNKNSIYGWTDKAKIETPSITISARGTIGWTNYINYPFYPIVRLIVLNLKIDGNLKYFYYQLKKDENNYIVPNSSIKQLTIPMIKTKKIPVLSIEKQNEIVKILDELNKYTNLINEEINKEIELLNKLYDYYFIKLLTF